MSKEIKKNNKGFTLIEILVAVLILAILVAIALPTYNRAVEKSRASDPINTLKTVAKAEQVQRLRTGGYTDQVQDLDLELKDYPAGNTITGDTFAGQYYNYKIYGEDEAAAKATRKGTNEGEEDFYELSVDYNTGELFCRPSTNKTCIDLGLEEGQSHNPPEPVCTTEERNGQSVYRCDYGRYTIDQEKWCNGNYPQYVYYWDPTHGVRNTSCVEGETKWEDDMWTTTLKKCTTSGSNSSECLPNSYYDTVLEISRPMDDELRNAPRSSGGDVEILTEITCETRSSDGDCLRYLYMYEHSDASAGGCDRNCIEIDETGFGCKNWGSWDCD